MNKEKLKVLFIEDSEDDFLMMLRELQKGKYEIEYELTEDAKSFKSALKKKWDIIISDYSLPGFNGFDALKICNKIGIDTPFIVVSGTIGEDIAVDMMRAGAKDYIMKKNLKFLLPAVEREIEDAKVRRERKQAEQEITMLAYAMKSINECVSITDIDDNIIFVNQAFLRNYGYTENEIIGKNISIFGSDKNPKEIHSEIHSLAMKGEWQGELINTKKDGTEFPINLSSTSILNNEGKPIAYIGVANDITNRKQAEESLIESEEHYRTLLTAIPDLMFRLDREGRFIDYHAEDSSILFAPPEKFLGKHYEEILPPDISRKFEKTVKEVKKTGDIGIFEYEAVLPNNEFHCYEARITCFGNECVLIIRDVTEQKNAEKSLKESEERYRILIETMNEGVILVDNDDVIQFMNKRCYKIYGYEPEEVIGKIGYEILVAEEDRHIILEKNKLRVADSVSDNYEIRGVKKSGEIIWLNISGAPVKDKNGKVVGSVGIMIDITERKQADEDLKKLSRAVEQSPVSVVITDVNGNIEYVNPKFIDLTGYQPEEVIGSNPNVLKSGETPESEYKTLWDSITSGKDWIGEFHNKKKNGELYWESAIISPVKNSNGKITHFLAIKEDITEKKLKEIELINAKEKAEESERLKSSFLANMSHELRTPMVGILGFAEIIKDCADDPEVKDFALNITKSGRRLLETLNLILDLSRIEAGKLEIRTSEVDIVQLSKEVYKNYIPEADKKNLEIKFFSPVEQIICKVDERMLWESINNLINNAVKYTKAGEVNIDVSSEKNKAFIKVKDTGIGIPKESLDTIFEEFRQVSEGYSRGFEGTGLGLTITKNFIMKNSGKISVESEIGIGSVFTIELPILSSISYIKEKPTKEIDIIEEEYIPEKRDIQLLCVDDDSFTREYLELIIKNIYKISFAENGFTAIEMCKSQKFSLILMDINLGKGMDGIETARKIRMLQGYENAPMIAMTAFAMKGDREEFLNGGMEDYISKPFKSNDLIKVIDKVIRDIKPK